MQAKGFVNYRLKYCWPKVFYCIWQPNDLEREIKKKTGGANRGPSKILEGPWPTQAPPYNRHWNEVLKENVLFLCWKKQN